MFETITKPGEFVTVSIDLRVWNEASFRRAAELQALKDGANKAEAKQYRYRKRTSLGECAQMLFDPGLSPDGCEILQSRSE